MSKNVSKPIIRTLNEKYMQKLELEREENGPGFRDQFISRLNIKNVMRTKNDKI